jgi:hypothetical protein
VSWRCLLLMLWMGVVWYFAGCHRGPAPVLTMDADASIPGGARALSGVNLEAFQRSALYSHLPQPARSLFESIPDAKHLYLVWNGQHLLILAEGRFHAPPPGFILLSSHLSAGGSPDAVQAAEAQHRTGHTGAPDLLAAVTATIPQRRTLWIVAAGNASLPFTGNAANLTRLLRYTQYTAVTAQLEDRAVIETTSLCGSTGQALDLEERLHGLASLLWPAAARDPDLAALWKSVRIEASGNTVHVALTLSPEQTGKLLAYVLPSSGPGSAPPAGHETLSPSRRNK